MEERGCQGKPQFTHSEEDCIPVTVNSQQTHIHVCIEVSSNSVRAQTMADGKPQSCTLPSTVSREYVNSEAEIKRSVFDSEEVCTVVNVDSKQTVIPVYSEESSNSVGAETLVDGTPTSCMMTSTVSRDYVYSEAKGKRSVLYFEEECTVVNMDSKQQVIAVCSEVSANSLRAQRSADGTLEECTDVNLDSKQPDIPVCGEVSSNSFAAYTLADGKPDSCTLPSSFNLDYVDSEAKTKICVADSAEECTVVNMDSESPVISPVISVCSVVLSNSFGGQTLADGKLATCKLPPTVSQDYVYSEAKTKGSVVDCEEESTVVNLDSKQLDTLVCSEVSSNSIGAQTLADGKPSSCMLPSSVSQESVNLEAKTTKRSVVGTMRRDDIMQIHANFDYIAGILNQTHIISGNKLLFETINRLKESEEEFTDVKVDSQQPIIPVSGEVSSNSIGAHTMVHGKQDSCTVPSTISQDFVNSQAKTKRFLIEGREECTVVSLDSKQPVLPVCSEISSNSTGAQTLADEKPAGCTLQWSISPDSVKSEAKTNRYVVDCKQECTDIKVDSKQSGIPVCSDFSSGSVTLVWDKPQRNVNAIQHYEVKYTLHGEKKWRSVDTKDNMNSFRIEGLKSNTAYDFRVRAVYDDDDDDEAPLSNICQNIMTGKQTSKVIPNGAQKLTDDKLAIYKLPLTDIQNSVNVEAKTRKCVFGNRPPGSFHEKTVMVVGGTGAGKSTMINAIVNYIMDVNWEDDMRYSIIDLMGKEKENNNDESKSQTEWITCYTVFPQEGSKLDYTFRMIDTPGFGDTGGIDMDRAIVRHLGVLFNSSGEKGIEILDAVWFVAKAPDARLTPSQRYIFDSILSIFGKDIEKNIFVIVTFADNKNPPVMKALKAAEVPFEKHFIFNNSSLFVNQEDHEGNECGQMYWKMGKESFKQLFYELGKTQQRSIQLTAEVLETRRKLEATIQGVQRQIRYGLSKLDTIRQEQRIFEEHEAKVEANEDFEYEVTETHQKKVDLEQGSYVTNCLDCNTTCHYPCSIPDNEGKKNCAAMRDGKCTACEKKCDWQRHVNNQYRFDLFSVPVKKTHKQMKEKYGMEQLEAQKHHTILDKLKEEFDKIKENVSSSIQFVRESVNRLKQMALKEDPLSHIQYIDLLIQCENRESKPGFLERIQMLEAMKKQAELLQTLPDANYDPWAEFIGNSSAQ